MVSPIKKELVSDLTELLKKAHGIVFSTHQGLQGNQSVMLRRYMREQGLTFIVRKNTLSSIALKEAGYTGLPEDLLTQSTAIIVTEGEAGSAFRAFFEKKKDYEKLEVKGGIYEGKFVTPKEAETIAKLGTKEQVLSSVLGTLNAPITSFVGALAGILRKFVGTVDAVRANKTDA